MSLDLRAGDSVGEILWITNVGKQVYAVVNPLWAWCIEGYSPPTEIYLIWNEAVKKELEIVIKLITRLYSALGYTPRIKLVPIPEEFRSYNSEFSKLVNELLRREDIELLIMDMTPGRKFMSAVIAKHVLDIKEKIRNKDIKISTRIVYLHLRDMAYQNVPYPLIPFPKLCLEVYGD